MPDFEGDGFPKEMVFQRRWFSKGDGFPKEMVFQRRWFSVRGNLPALPGGRPAGPGKTRPVVALRRRGFLEAAQAGAGERPAAAVFRFECAAIWRGYPGG
jgi:hypothetical protein